MLFSYDQERPSLRIVWRWVVVWGRMSAAEDLVEFGSALRELVSRLQIRGEACPCFVLPYCLGRGTALSLSAWYTILGEVGWCRGGGEWGGGRSGMGWGGMGWG